MRKLNVGKGFKDGERIAGKTEEEAYDKVGLPYIPPELQEESR